MEPWICPRCGQVWAGWVAKCDCKPSSNQFRPPPDSTGDDFPQEKKEWIANSKATN